MQKKNDEFIDLIVNDCMVDFRQQYNKEYETINEVISIFRLCEDRLEKMGLSQQNVYILASIMQLNKLYQSSIIILERGLKEPAYGIIRTILDLTFKIIEVIRNEEFIDLLSLHQQYETKKCLEDIKNNKLFDMVSEDEVIKLIEKCNEEIKGEKKPKIKAYDLAKKNGFDKAYILYRLQCDYTHQSNSVIESTIKVTENGYYIDGNFQIEDFKMSIALLISITVIIFPILNEEYIKEKDLNVKYNIFIKNFEENFNDLLK